MPITLISDPSHVIQVSPAIICRWLATECPNNFALQRKDWTILNASEYAGSPAGTAFEVDADFTGSVGDIITIVDGDGVAHSGAITDITDSPARNLLCDIAWSDFASSPAYMNDETLYGGYYFEGRLTVNGVAQTLTVIASPNTVGLANIDVSGILRIMVSLGKTGDYSALVMAETNKGGSFTFAYRGCWYGSNEAYTEEGNTWYYTEAVRSIEQGSNLYEYFANDAEDAPFMNAFAQPVYFEGFPFDLTFLLPERDAISPAAELTITISRYNAANVLLSTTIETISVGSMEGRPCSLNINPASLEAEAAYMLAEITAP
jgi:hypothetical protein